MPDSRPKEDFLAAIRQKKLRGDLMSINDKVKELTSEITGTKEYSELKQAKTVIDKSKDLRSKIGEFKKKEESLYKEKLSAGEAQKRAAELNRVFENLTAIPEVKRFVKAEKEFNDLMQRVFKTISDSLESTLK